MSNILNQAGKGDAPRNCQSKAFRDEYDRIFGKRGPVCPHGLHIGDDCPDCVRNVAPSYVISNHQNRKTITK